MKGNRLLAVLLAALLLVGCTQHGNNADPQEPPEQEQPQQNMPAPKPQQGEETPALVKELAVELVVTWQASDQLLSRLEELGRLLQAAIAEQGRDVERVTVTISTAGGITADALTQGGVDVAFLPGEDYLSCGDGVCAVLTGGDEPAAVVAAAGKNLDADFCAVLEKALLDTEGGRAFLETYDPGVEMIPAEEAALQALAERAEEDEHGA